MWTNWAVKYDVPSFSIFTWHHRAGLDYLQQAGLTAYSDQLSGVCRWLRAQRLLYLLGRRKEDKSLGNVNGAAVTCNSAYLCMIHRYLSQSPPPPKAGRQTRAAAPVQTPRAASHKNKTSQLMLLNTTEWEYLTLTPTRLTPVKL